MSTPDKYKNHIHSYLALRKTVGWIGIALPFVLLIGTYLIDCYSWSSISHYYHSTMGRVFIGSLCAVALFMFFYTGFNWQDDWAGNFAGFFALGVAWIPITETSPIDWVGWVHNGFAISLFLTFAFFSLKLFTKTKNGDDANRTYEKRKRDRIYKVCGWVILYCIASIIIFEFLIKTVESFPYTFWAETTALVAFGFSWLTKGGRICPDKKES